MRLMLKASFLSLTLLLIGFSLNSCVDEPTIAPVKRAYSVLKVVNVTTNVPGMKVFIDDKQQNIPAAMEIGTGTEYFDIASGKHKLTVYDANNNLLLTNEVEISSFERQILVIAGTYNANLDLNSLSNFIHSEGEIYVSSAPEAGLANIYFIHASAPFDTSNFKTFSSLNAVYTLAGDTTSLDTSYTLASDLVFGESAGISARPGNYTFTLVSTDTSVILNHTSDIQADLRYYLYIHGTPNSPVVLESAITPPAIRNRDEW